MNLLCEAKMFVFIFWLIYEKSVYAYTHTQYVSKTIYVVQNARINSLKQYMSNEDLAQFMLVQKLMALEIHLYAIFF